MARKVEDPRWKEAWYREFQSQYGEWMERAKKNGVRDNSGMVIKKIGELENYLAKELNLTQSVVHAWSRQENTKGATYPENEKMLHRVWELLHRTDKLPTDKWALVSVLYREFCHIVQGSGLQFLYDREPKYQELLRQCEIYKPGEKWDCLDMERRCALAESLRGCFLTEKEIDILFDFYTAVPSSESCGTKVFRQVCDSEQIWSRAERLLRRSQEAMEQADAWMDQVEEISRKKIAPGIRFAPYYWKIMDEYLEEWLDKISDQTRVKEFNLVRMIVDGYVPLSFSLQFAFEYTDFDALRKKYLFVPLASRKINVKVKETEDEPLREIDLSNYADMHDWLEREGRENQISIKDFRIRKYYALRRDIYDRLRDAQRVERILEVLGGLTGIDRYKKMVPEYADRSAIDWAVCLKLESEDYQREHPKAFRLGFSNADEAREAFRRYENDPVRDEGRRVETAVRLILLVLRMEGASRCLRWPEEEFLIPTGLTELLEPELQKSLIEFILYSALSETELFRQLSGMQQAFALRERYLPELTDFFHQLHREVLAQEQGPPVVEVMKRFAEKVSVNG